MESSYETAYSRLRAHVRRAAILESVGNVLGWDERCLMPPAGVEHRAEQIGLLAGMAHDLMVTPEVGEWLESLAASPLIEDPASDAAVTIRELRREYQRQSRLPRALVEELTKAATRGQSIWQEARKRSDYARFRPALERMLQLKREEADALGGPSRYDALLDTYEPGESTAHLSSVLGALREALVPLVGAIAASPRKPDIGLLERDYPVDVQAQFGQEAAARIGFDFTRGRLDVTAHPFCLDLGPHDCRITTRYDARFFNAGLFGILHEAGHGIYEQGLSSAEYGLPLGRYVSTGIHESQSRLWENLIGRSREFWTWLFPQAQRAFPAALTGVPLEAFYFAINDVRPSLIRVEADEATYNLHILIRFELERDLIEDRLTVADLPAAWNTRYREYLGLNPPDDGQGVLQDIHWSAGLVGYFPTYALGNLYAAQFFDRADRDLGGLAAQVARGEFEPLRSWLRTNIHQHGRRFSAGALVEWVTGAALSHGPLIGYLRRKYEPLYGLA